MLAIFFRHLIRWLSRCLLPGALLAAAPAFPKGILVRFLGSSPDDSVARYDVYRHAAGDSARRIGSMPAVAGADTVSFPDTGAKKGAAYRYSIRAVDGAGRESDPSDSTFAAFPLLSLPDTLRSATWPVLWTLPASAHPLRGMAALTVELVRPGQVALAYDSASGRIEFRGQAGGTDTLRIALRGSYFGKFLDEDSAVIMVAGSAPVSISVSPHPGAAGPYGMGGSGWARNADGRPLPVLGLRRSGTRILYDAAGRRAGMLAP